MLNVLIHNYNKIKKIRVSLNETETHGHAFLTVICLFSVFISHSVSNA